ncbi:MAG TPA: MBL fold metallo-hydrolase [Jatrophihabitans sp.]|nr:MBL fold metallo-hydrolase [Jatrophihabitans sp.]
MTWIEPGPERVASGVHRIALPLPDDGLRAVNVYALSGPGGLSLIDGGWALAESLETLASALCSIGFGLAEIEQCLVTHVHRDHYTQAVTLQREYGTRISLGAGERANLDRVSRMSEAAGDRFVDTMSYLVRCGAGALLAQLAQARHSGDGARDWAPPEHWLADEQQVAAGGRELTVVHTPGHTAGHVVFHDAAAGLLFAGDHVLPHITPSIGFEPVRTAFPLRDYLDSLTLMLKRPDARLLPAHGPVSESVHARVHELLAHHDERLDATEHAVRAGATDAYEAAGLLPWTRRERRLADLDLFNIMLAVSETSAHLDVLVLQGRLRSETVEGVERYWIN